MYLHEWLDKDGVIGQHLIDFAELIQAPEEVHTFELTPYALWSAAAKEIGADIIIEFLQLNSLNRVSDNLIKNIRRNIDEFNTIRLSQYQSKLRLDATHKNIIERLKKDGVISQKIVEEFSQTSLLFNLEDRIQIKSQLFKLELFAIDSSTQCPGEILEIQIKERTSSGPLIIREYQTEAARRFVEFSPSVGGGGVIIMPPESGKTLVGLKIIETLKTNTLILVENPGSAKSWKEEILDKTDLGDDCISNLSEAIEIKPITIATYPNAVENLKLLESQNWGLIIYDDAHRLPANKNVFTTNISSKFKLALAATLARSDQKGTEVYELIGPKWFEVLPRTLEFNKYLKPIRCVEVRIPLTTADGEKYLNESDPNRLRDLSCLNPLKLDALKYIREKHWMDQLVIVSFRKHLGSQISKMLDLSLIKSSKIKSEEQKLIEDFNGGSITELLTSSVLEQLQIKRIDVLVATSYQKGSEREEYLRVGKVAGTKSLLEKGYIYSLVTEDTIEKDDYARRRKSLIKYGYSYTPISLEDLLEGKVV
jgi:DNA excision repair protein ERCC-3